MGLFGKKQDKEKDKDKSLIFTGESLQPIGKIPVGADTILTLDGKEKNLVIHYEKTEITLPYNRIVGFKLEDESTVSKGGSAVARALIGSALLGTAGAIGGGLSAKGKNQKRWIGTLMYRDKEGNNQEVGFIQTGLGGHYTGDQRHWGMGRFVDRVNAIASENAEDITEL